MPKVHHAPGPFRVDQLASGDPYELSEGHAIAVMPTGSRGSLRVAAAAAAIGSDPSVQEIGAETGHALSATTLRAPDLSVGNVPDAPGWVAGAPPLAIEYADRGQDEEELRDKIRDLLAAGTQQIWVVRLTGRPRVEVHAPGAPMVVRTRGELLAAPGILANPLPVEALFDVQTAHAVALRNLLQRHGYADLDAVRDEGARSGATSTAQQAIFQVLAARGLPVDDPTRARIEAERDPAVLARWLTAAVTATTAAAAIY